MSGSEPAEVRAGRRKVEITHPEREMFGDAGIDKLALAEYYVSVSEWILPHLRERPIHVRAYPDGIDGQGFVRKSVPGHYPEWIERARLPKREGGKIDQVVATNAATLAYLAGQNAISLHGWLSLRDQPERPDQIIIDLDPTGEDFEEVREAARIVREVLDELGLPAYLKTTGSRGLHLSTPLDRSATFEEAHELARGIATVAATIAPDRLTAATRKDKRRGRLFIDWLRNGYAQTAVVPYSVRARPEASVAMPISWRELRSVGPRDYTVANALRRLRRVSDPWEGMRRRARGLEGPRRRLQRLLAESREGQTPADVG
jgi:bifunctional non-homologous end joining protein LigD